MAESNAEIEVNDHVSFRKNPQVHWIVTNVLSSAPLVHLKSGLTGRRKFAVPLSELVLYKKGRSDGQ